jgi:hypothetical protein
MHCRVGRIEPGLSAERPRRSRAPPRRHALSGEGNVLIAGLIHRLDATLGDDGQLL